MNVQGVDISQWQGVIDWSVLKSKAGFIYIRSGDGMGYDDHYTYNLAGAREIGVWGNYHVPYCAIAASAAMQGRFHGQREAGIPGNLPPWIDFERPGNLTGVQLKAWLRAYLEEFEHACNRVPMIYCNPAMLRLLLPLPLWLVEDYKLAIAHYDAAAPLTYGWPWTFWQYHIYQPASDYGVAKPPKGSSGIDLDKYRGGFAEFEAEFGIAPNVGTVEPEPELPEYVTTIRGCNIRNKPVIERASDIGDLDPGARLKVTGEQDDWYSVQAWVSKSVVKHG